MGQHIGRDVNAVYRQTGPQIGQQQPTRATSDIEGGLAIVVDEFLIVGNLWSVEAVILELRPMPGYEAIVPCLWFLFHSLLSSIASG
jgi:hypothetical protein